MMIEEMDVRIQEGRDILSMSQIKVEKEFFLDPAI